MTVESPENISSKTCSPFEILKSQKNHSHPESRNFFCFLTGQNLKRRTCFWADIFRAFYCHIGLSLGKVWARNTVIQFLAVRRDIDKTFSKMAIISEEQPMGTCPSGVFHTTLGSTLCTKFEAKIHWTVASVPSSAGKVTLIDFRFTQS